MSGGEKRRDKKACLRDIDESSQFYYYVDVGLYKCQSCYNENFTGYSFPKYGCANATLVKNLVEKDPGNSINFNIYFSQKNGFGQDKYTYLVPPSIVASTKSWSSIEYYLKYVSAFRQIATWNPFLDLEAEEQWWEFSDMIRKDVSGTEKWRTYGTFYIRDTDHIVTQRERVYSLYDFLNDCTASFTFLVGAVTFLRAILDGLRGKCFRKKKENKFGVQAKEGGRNGEGGNVVGRDQNPVV